MTIPKKRSKVKPLTRIQYGALPYRFNESGSVEVLLITSRKTKRWIIPKGWPIKGLKPSKAAAREAYEEAGVRGRIARRAFGHYVYEKRLEDSIITIPCQVQVFLLTVERQSKDWPELKQRMARWFPAAEAARARRQRRTARSDPPIGDAQTLKPSKIEKRWGLKRGVRLTPSRNP
jgi:8-oxo-dGTP pyrophosphatase MutT (NUDIX family)